MSFYQKKIQSDFGHGCLFRNCKWTANTVQLGFFVNNNNKKLLVTALQQDKNFSFDHAHFREKLTFMRSRGLSVRLFPADV